MKKSKVLIAVAVFCALCVGYAIALTLWKPEGTIMPTLGLIAMASVWRIGIELMIRQDKAKK